MSPRGSQLAARFGLLGLVILSQGCERAEDRPPPSFAVCPAGADAAAPEPAAPDYWHDAKPILDCRCATCHTADGIAPFRLLTYADAQASALLIEGVVESRAMPPWPPNDCCQTYAHDRSLPAAERELLLRWLEAGAPEGDPQGAPPSMPPAPPALARIDVEMTLREPYLPMAQTGTSDLRCFLVEGPHAQDEYVTGIDVRPGDRAVVQHVIVHAVAEGDLPDLRARDGADGRPGFDCRELREELHGGVLGSWAPGGAPFESPEGKLGIAFPAGAQLMVEIEYDVRNGVTQPDQTTVQLQVADTVEHPARNLVVTATTPQTPVFLHGVALHMHALGSSGRVAIHRADGSWDCLLDLPAWDERWADVYRFTEPVPVRAGDRLYVECHWKGPAPRPKGEVCAGILLATDTWP